MTAYRLKWSSLLHLTELEFVPEAPKVLSVTDELAQAISWLTGATNHDRRLLRCNELGALLVGNAWDNLAEVETDELNPDTDTPDSFTKTATIVNKGVLVATSTVIVKIDFVRVYLGSVETIYLPPNYLYFYPYPTYSVTATLVPVDSATACYVGITACN